MHSCVKVSVHELHAVIVAGGMHQCKECSNSCPVCDYSRFSFFARSSAKRGFYSVLRQTARDTGLQSSYGSLGYFILQYKRNCLCLSVVNREKVFHDTCFGLEHHLGERLEVNRPGVKLQQRVYIHRALPYQCAMSCPLSANAAVMQCQLRRYTLQG